MPHRPVPTQLGRRGAALALLTALLLAGASPPAAAHGDAAHAKAATAVRKEQKPWGIAGEPRTVARTIDIRMSDAMRFTPDHIAVRLGETVRLRVHNRGKLLHELVIGTPEELQAHAALMLKFPAMEHDEPSMAHVPAGKSGELVWTFNRAGSFDFACLVAGHFQAGMVGRIVVSGP